MGAPLFPALPASRLRLSLSQSSLMRCALVIRVLETGDATGRPWASEGQNRVPGSCHLLCPNGVALLSTPPVLGVAGDAGGGCPLASPWRTARAPPPEAASPVLLPCLPLPPGSPLAVCRPSFALPGPLPFLCPVGSSSSFKTQLDGHLPWSLQLPSPPWAAVPPLSLVSIHPLVDFQYLSNTCHIQASLGTGGDERAVAPPLWGWFPCGGSALCSECALHSRVVDPWRRGKPGG